MITTMIGHPDVHVLAPTTLLIQKIIPIQERCSEDTLKRMKNDAVDIIHLLRQVMAANNLLSTTEKGNGGPAAVKAVWEMMEEVKKELKLKAEYSAQFKAGWNQYATMNGLDAT